MRDNVLASFSEDLSLLPTESESLCISEWILVKSNKSEVKVSSFEIDFATCVGSTLRSSIPKESLCKWEPWVFPNAPFKVLRGNFRNSETVVIPN